MMQEAIQDLKRSSTEEAGIEIGVRLRRAREAAQLTQQEVAQRLRLRLSVLIALENDQYELLPAPTFVMGYLRMYSRLMGIPADEIVQAYNQLSHLQSTYLTAPIAIDRPTNKISGRVIKSIILLVFLAFLGITARWLYLQNKVHTTPQPVQIPVPAATQINSTNLTEGLIQLNTEAASISAPTAMPASTPIVEEDETEDD